MAIIGSSYITEGRKMRAGILWQLLAIGLCSIASAATRLVPQQYATIQAAIDDCNDGDIVIIAPGTYTGIGNRDIDYKGKAITIRSTDPNDPKVVAATIIDCNGTKDEPNRGFNFRSGEDNTSVLAGLTIINGFAPSESVTDIGSRFAYGGGIKCSDASSPVIRKCAILHNTAGWCFELPSRPPDTNRPRDRVGGGYGCIIGSGGGVYATGNSYPIIDRCIVSDNTATVYPRSSASGGGLSLDSGSSCVLACLFERNSATSGGAIGSINNSTLKVVDSVFRNNTAADGGGAIEAYRGSLYLDDCAFTENSSGFGGALATNGTTSMVLDCMFLGNRAGQGGAALSNGDSQFVRCVFTANTAGSGGAALCWRTTTFINSLFIANSAWSGGAITCAGAWSSQTKTILKNCTLTANQATKNRPSSSPSRGGAISCGADSTTSIANSILWNNLADYGSEIYLDSVIDAASRLHTSKATIVTTNVKRDIGAIYGEGDNPLQCTNVIETDPCFAYPGYWEPNGTPNDKNDDFWVDGDYHLKSQASRWQPAHNSPFSILNSQLPHGTWVKDDVTSPCIDAGDPATPIGFEPFPNGGIVNMGAYGGTPEASKSYFGGPVCETIVAGDINGDCKVDFKDFSFIALHWLEDNQSDGPTETE